MTKWKLHCHVRLAVLLVLFCIAAADGQIPHLEVEGDARIKGRIDMATNADSTFDKSNVFIGHETGIFNTISYQGIGTGLSNTYIGAEAGRESFIGTLNTFVGASSGFNSSGLSNTFIGVSAGGRSSDGSHNTYLGTRAGFFSASNFNTYVGVNAGPNNSSGGSGGSNAALGHEAMTNFRNGQNNLALGKSAGQNFQNGDRNTFIGSDTKVNPGLIIIDDAIALGHGATVGCDACAVIGGIDSMAVNVGIGLSEPASPLDIKQRNISGVKGIRLEDHDSGDDWAVSTIADFLTFSRNGVIKATISPVDGMYTASDLRLKRDIMELDYDLNAILKLSPKKYQYRDALESHYSIGFIAQEVKKYFPELVASSGEYLTLNYNGFAVLALQAIKQQQVLISNLTDQNEELKNRVYHLEETFIQLKEELRSVD